MRTLFRATLSVLSMALVCSFCSLPTAAQTSAGPAGSLSQAEINQIITTFTAKETQFRKALLEYGFKRDVLLQEMGMGGQVIGEYHRVSNFTFDEAGNRYEKIIYFPLASFQAMSVSQEDIEDLGGVNPFAVESEKAALYAFKYVGKERIDEVDLYVFDVSPKVVPDAKKTKVRFFQGRIWIDDKDLQVVKSRGKGIPETKKNKFPVVETYREFIDKKYWFPTYSYADEELVFDDGQVLRLRIRVKYTDYSRGSGKLRVIDMEGEAPEAKAKPEPAKPKPRED